MDYRSIQIKSRKPKHIESRRMFYEKLRDKIDIQDYGSREGYDIR
jgi:hypothetical protein